MVAPTPHDGALDGLGDVASEGAGNTDGADAPGDGGDDRSTNCTARFNFENGALYGASINSASLVAFKSISNSDAVTLCGSGALEIDAMFGTDGGENGGDVGIPLNSPSEDLSGKTLTINVRAEPPGMISFYVFLVTPKGYDPVPGTGFPIRLTQDQWYTASYTFPSIDGGVPDGGFPDGGPTGGLPDGSVADMWTVYRLSLQVFGYKTDGAVTKIYVDEMDLK